MHEEKKRKTDGLFEFLYDYAEIREELEAAMMTLKYIQAEIGYAMEELRDEMEIVEKHMEASSNRLYRFRNPRLPGLCEGPGRTPGNRL